MKEIKIRRIMKDLTQKEISEKLGIPQSLYSRKESGKVSFTLEEAIKLAEIFDEKVEVLFKK